MLTAYWKIMFYAFSLFFTCYHVLVDKKLFKKQQHKTPNIFILLLHLTLHFKSGDFFSAFIALTKRNSQDKFHDQHKSGISSNLIDSKPKYTQPNQEEEHYQL